MPGNPHRGIHGQTVEILGRRILRGQIAPGDTLDLTSLQDELDLSRTAMREVLKVLSAKGLVGARQKRGTFVRDRREWNLLDGDVMRWRSDSADQHLLSDLDEVRTAIEPASAALAAARRTAADITALTEALQAMGAAGDDPAAAVAADIAFHRALAAAAKNELLGQVQRIMTPSLKLRDELVHARRDVRDPVPAHRALLDRVLAGDPAGAEAAMRQLLEESHWDAAAAVDGDRADPPAAPAGDRAVAEPKARDGSRNGARSASRSVTRAGARPQSRSGRSRAS